MDYGLAFYRNEPLIHYDTDGVPGRSTCWLFERTIRQQWITGWQDGCTQPLFLYDSQGLEVYKVDAQP